MNPNLTVSAQWNGRWKGMQHIDPMTETTWGFVWGYDVLKAVNQPAGEVLGLSATREGKNLKRPESQRAFSLWKSAFSPEQVARGHDGLREGYEEFLAKNFPLGNDVNVEPVELRGVPALRVSASKKKGERAGRAAFPWRRVCPWLCTRISGVCASAC